MIRILVGDVRERLAELPDGSVQCVVTSPPYFGLRDYNVEGQIGLEPTLAEYIATLVDVFRDVRRVLHPTGCMFLNLGDSYNSGTQFNHSRSNGLGGIRYGEAGNETWGGHRAMVSGFKPKDLMMVPARVAISLQDDGWYLRSDIIWAKKNCMPESVTDRPTSSHEHIFLLTKQSRYYYDAEAVREALEPSTVVRDKSPRGRKQNGGGSWESMNGIAHTLELGDMASNPAGRNQRNVWHLATEPFPEAHFATFPTEIPRRCIAAGTSEKGQCAACGAPWVRIVDKATRYESGSGKAGNMPNGKHGDAVNGGNVMLRMGPVNETTTTGWRPSCSCDADVVPQTVLDPFLGSGTTLLVADRLGRNGVGIELNEDYARMAEQRIRGDAPMFADVAAD